MRPTNTADLLARPDDDLPDSDWLPILLEPSGPEDPPSGLMHGRTVLAYGLALGVAADALLRDGPVGLGMTLWVVVAAMALIGVTWRSDRDIVPETRFWLLTACGFGAFMSWRADEPLQLLNLAAIVFALGMAAVVQSGVPVGSLMVARVRDVLTSVLRVARDSLTGTIPLLRSVSAQSETFESMNNRRGPLLRAAVLTIPVVLVFGALLRSADPIFASFVNTDFLDWGSLASHLIVIAIFAWLSTGWLSRPATGSAPVDIEAAEESRLPLEIGITEVTALLGAPVVLLGAFILAQLGWFFGGEEFLRQQTGLTVAEYARQGFFQMFLVAVISTGLLLGTRAMLVADRSAHGRHTRLALLLLGLVLAVVISAVARLALYVRYYGLTDDRFYAAAAIAWLAFVMLWLAVTVLRDRGERFVAGAVGAGLAMLIVLNFADPAAIIARTNLGRTPVQAGSQTGTHDLAYLTGLNDGAVPLTVEATLRPAALPDTESVAVDAARCSAAQTLLDRWDPESGGRALNAAMRENRWRIWSLGNHRAANAVQRRAGELRVIARECARDREAAAAPDA